MQVSNLRYVDEEAVMEQQQMEVLVEFIKALGQAERLRIAGLLVDHNFSIAQLSEQLGLRESVVSSHLQKLVAAGLATTSDHNGTRCYRLDSKALEQLNRKVFAQSNRARNVTREELSQRIFRHYVDGEQLKELPVNYEEQMVILRWLAEHFQEGIRYPEREVNQILKRHYPDYALLRRYLVDNHLMQRAGGFYWRQDGK